MKTISFLILLLFLVNVSFSQSFHAKMSIDVDFGIEVDISDGKNVEVPKSLTDLKKVKVKSTDLPANHKLLFTVGGETQEYTPTALAELTFTNNIIDKQITVKHIDNTNSEVIADKIAFKIVPKTDDDQTTDDDSGDIIQPSIDSFLEANYSNLEPTPFGFINPTENNRIIHIFFDQYGNSLKSTVPQGISNAQYMVHIVYPISNANPNKISYSVKQKTGSFSSTLLFNNTGVRGQAKGVFQSGEKFDQIVERTFLLATATDDLAFDIISKEGKATKTVLESYTLKMTPVFHGSFDVGLIKTSLQNPTFSLVQSPTTTDNVVKITDESPKGLVTVMASFYASPIVLLESLGRKIQGKSKIPFYKLTGRNFLDDHKIYERFYPTVGVSLSSSSFENIFYGINWEVARGLAIFGGWHYGKVNTFEMPDFKPEVTIVTQKQFDFYQKTRWMTSTAVGVKLDILIIRNLFTAAGAAQ